MLTMILGEPGTPSPFQYPAGVGVGTALVVGGTSAQLARNTTAASARKVRMTATRFIRMRRVIRLAPSSIAKI
jgi:hypothetical protein